MADEDNRDRSSKDPDESSPSSEPSSESGVSAPTNGGTPPAAVAATAAHAPVAAHAVAGAHGHGGLAHTMPIPLLVGVLAALMALTIITVAVTNFDLGAQGNLVVAMVIATLKAGLVVAFFMHLVWDKKLHLILFLTSVLFLILFLSLSVNDRGEYQSDIDAFSKSVPAK